jgi:hypothetical protein
MADTDREAELLARLAVLEARYAELDERARDAEARAREHGGESIESLLTAFLPSEARTHLRAARKEQLLAARAVLDHLIDRVDRKPPERRRRESIHLEES